MKLLYRCTNQKKVPEAKPVLLTVGEFKHRVVNDIDHLVAELQEITGRVTIAEEQAWRSSLPNVARAFSNPSFEPLQLYFGSKGNLGLEYQLPASSSWCDVVLLGSHHNRPSAIICELKDWVTYGDKPGAVEGLIVHHGETLLHPSDQVRGYTEYCRHYHSAIHEYNASIYGCVIFTKEYFIDAYSRFPNQDLAENYPCFTLNKDDVGTRLPEYFSSRITAPDPKFADAFDKGTYKQDRGFVRQIGAQILDPKNSPFVLLDNQRRAFALAQTTIDESLFQGSGSINKQVIIVDGPPGSGKSVIAVKLWASLVLDDRLPDGSVVFTTTSASQNSNWEYLFSIAGHDRGASGIVKKATSYTPITTQAVGTLRNLHGAGLFSDALKWRQNLRELAALGVPVTTGARDDEYLITIVDEAHALINPEHSDGRGQFGFAPTLGPQAYHIIRTSKVSIFFLDAEQSFRDRENTTVDDIRAWAKELGADIHEDISLRGSQFRCAGSKEYIDWVEGLLRGDPPEKLRALAKIWSQHLDFRLFESIHELEGDLRNRANGGATARLLASYARRWKTKGAAAPHDLPPHMMDFHEPDAGGYWSKPWNYVPKGSDYTPFVQAIPGSRMHDDPLCEVGCPYAVRGFDFDYVGMLWLGDLRWRNNAWEVDKDHVFETGLVNATRRAKKEEQLDGPAHQELKKAVAQGYRILLSRPMKGIYLWVEDEATRKRIQESL